MILVFHGVSVYQKKGTQTLHQPTGRVVSAGKFIGDFDPQDPRWWG